MDGEDPYRRSFFTNRAEKILTIVLLSVFGVLLAVWLVVVTFLQWILDFLRDLPVTS